MARAQTETVTVWPKIGDRRRHKVLARRYAVLFAMVFAASMLGLWLGTVSAGDSSVWVGNGMYIGFALRINPRRRNELLAVGFAANYLANRLGHLSPIWSMGLTAADMVYVVTAMAVFRHRSVHSINLTNVRTLLQAGFYAAVAGSFAGMAFMTVWDGLALKLPFDPPFLFSWFCSDAIGSSVTIPLVWSYWRGIKSERRAGFKYQTELAFFLFCGVAGALFWQSRYPFLFLLFPMLIPVVYTSAFLGAAWAVLITTVIGVTATAYGHGPLMLVHTSSTGRVLFLQFYLFVVLVTALPFAVLLMERERLIQKLKTSEARYRDLARLDGLTLLPNRREFDSFLDISRQRAVRQNTPLSLLLVDIDHFKKLNDQHGHTVGDEYLRKMATAIASAVPRKTDLVARYGGEEFGVILDSCDDAGAMMVAERIKEAAAALSKNLVAHNRPAVTISIGMATTLPILRTPSKVLIDAADQGLYAAKRNGRNRIERGTNLMEAALV